MQSKIIFGSALKRALIVVALATAAGAFTPACATIVDVTYTGTVVDGTFAGQSYTAAYVFDTADSTAVQNIRSLTNNYVYGGTGYGSQYTNPLLSAVLTIGSNSTAISGNWDGWIYGYNSGTSAEQYHYASDSSNYLVNYIYRNSNSSIPATIETPFTYTLQLGDGSGGGFCADFGSGQTCGDLSPQSITETLDVRAVPGPTVGAGASSFALAALFLGWLVRRRGHQTV